MKQSLAMIMGWLGVISMSVASVDERVVTVVWGPGPIVLPAGEALARLISIHNLRQIGLAARELCNRREDGRLPKSFEEMVLELDLPAEVFISPRFGRRAVPEAIRHDRAARARWVEQNTDYVWLGADLFEDVPAELIWAHEKQQGMDDGLCMIYADGHAEHVPEERVGVTFWQTDQIREQLGLPRLDRRAR